MGGCIAGLAQSPLVCAVDLVKTQRQVQSGWAGEPPLQIARLGGLELSEMPVSARFPMVLDLFGSQKP